MTEPGAPGRPPGSDRTDRGRRQRWGPPQDDDRPRLFFAIPVPEPARTQVAELAERVRAATNGLRARWVRFEGLHLTLRFLGPTPPEAVPELVAALEAVAVRRRPFDVTLDGGGAFPGSARPRTLWVAVTSGGADLESLAGELAADPRVAPLVPPRPDRAGADERFAPHLTVARTDGVRGAGSLARALQAEAVGLDARFTADRVALYRSRLGDGPARYEIVHEAGLGG